MQYEDTTRIATPEGVEIEFVLAGVGSRLTARILDALIQVPLLVVLLIIYAAALEDSSLASGIVAAIAVVMSFLVFWGYDVLFEAFHSGRTPGKQWSGLRVIGLRGGPETFTMAAIRNVMRLVDEVLTLYLAAFASITRSPRNQRLGDMAAGTLVIREGSRGSTVEAGVSMSSLDALTAARTWDTAGVGANDVAAARQFLERRYGIAPEARTTLAGQLAERLRPRVHGADPALPPEQFLELLVAVKAERG